MGWSKNNLHWTYKLYTVLKKNFRQTHTILFEPLSTKLLAHTQSLGQDTINIELLSELMCASVKRAWQEMQSNMPADFCLMGIRSENRGTAPGQQGRKNLE